MVTITANNVNDAWAEAKRLLNDKGVKRPSRVGEVIEVPEPVTTKYRFPMERVLFDSKRNCNPYFHFMEGLWMLSGRNDVAFPAQFAKRMVEFSDNGETFNAAYGYRWRSYFSLFSAEHDQLVKVIAMLKKNPYERRAVLQMWDPEFDLGSASKDVPCNTCVYFKIRDGMLYMTVSNRSNDIVWGCYGANVVHMSMMMEYVASMVGVSVGPYHQVSDSWHAYTEFWEQYGGLPPYLQTHPDMYANGVAPYPMVKDPGTWDQELQDWMAESTSFKKTSNPLFSHVATPMYQSWLAHKKQDYSLAYSYARSIAASDWSLACVEWLDRLLAARKEREKIA